MVADHMGKIVIHVAYPVIGIKASILVVVGDC